MINYHQILKIYTENKTHGLKRTSVLLEIHSQLFATLKGIQPTNPPCPIYNTEAEEMQQHEGGR